MKYFNIFFIVLILFSVVKQSYTQEFWEIVDMPEGVGIYDIDFSQDNQLYAAVTGNDGARIIRQSLNGAGWDTILSPGGIISEILIDYYQNIYAFGNHRLYYSFDQGTTWNSQYLDSISASVSGHYKLDNGNFLLGTWGGIYKCDSVGNEGSYVFKTPHYEKFNAFIYNADSSIIYAGSTNFPEEGGGIYCSYDDGFTWENTALTGSYVSSLSINSQGDLFAGSQGNFLLGYDGVYRLLNGADEWEQVNPYEVVSSIAIASNDDIYLGCTLEGWPGGVRLSQDNGNNWITLNDGLINRNIKQVKISRDNYIYIVESGNTNTLYRSIDTIYTFLPEPQDVPKPDIKIYPNPIKDKIYLHVAINSSITGNCRFLILDAKGEQVYSERLEIFHYKQIDLGFLNPGIYYLIFNTDTQQIMSKHIKL